MDGNAPTIVLVHGGFADASGFAGVIERLEACGYPVVAPGNPLRSLAGDAETLRLQIAAMAGPLVLVGHAYGGAVITQAAASLDSVIGLVHLAAFGPDIDESCDDLHVRHPAPNVTDALVASPYEAPGLPGGPDLTLDRALFHEVMCDELSEMAALVLATTQRSLARSALHQETAAKAWDVIPSWFLIADRDRVIAPAGQRFMAERMHATTESLDTSHMSLLASPDRVAAFIERAARSFMPRVPGIAP